VSDDDRTVVSRLGRRAGEHARAGLEHAGVVFRIARWEVLKGTETVDRRTVVGFVVAVAVTAALGVALSGATVAHDAGIYRIAVEEDSPYHAPAAEDPTFDVVQPGPDVVADGRAEVAIRSGEVVVANSRKGRAALSEFRSTVKTYNDRQMLEESNVSAAFPVTVELEYVQREDVGPGTGDDTDGDSDGGNSTAGGGSGTAGGGQVSAPRIGGQPLLSSGQSGTPGSIQPPFPLGSLLLAFLFIVPMNFVIQAYGATILRERINRRGELLLVAPVAPGDIVAGKTLPYFLAILAVATVTAVGVGGGPVAVAAVAPIALLFLSATFLAAMFARSFKELTFLTVTISVTLTSYAFVPAVFTEVTPIALISPLTIVVRDLLGESTTAVEFAFSTGPLLLSSGVLFLLGTGIYREEDLFSQRPVHLKAVDALASRVRGRLSVGLLTLVFIPFVLVAELLAVALLFVFPEPLSIPVLLLSVAVIEELAKSLHVYAAYHHELFERRRVTTALSVGFASGVGFFVGEKVTLVVQLVQLPGIAEGQTAFPEAAAVGGPLLLAMLLAPLALHTVTASISAVGASRGPSSYVVAYGVAVVAHLAYNAGVLTLVA
jgi:ABC-type Na+ efflux pump permease subunit